MASSTSRLRSSSTKPFVAKLAPRRVREFKQARSERTYEALLTAAAKLFAERGYDATQTPDIAKAAGVATGAFYRYFDDKNQTFLEVMDRHLRAILAEVTADMQPERILERNIGSVREGIAAVLETLFKRVRRHADLQRVFLSMSYRDEAVMEMRMQAESQAIDMLCAVVETVIPRTVVPEPRAAAVVVFAAVMEIAANSTGIMPARARGVTDKALFAALVEMVYRYLHPTQP